VFGIGSSLASRLDDVIRFAADENLNDAITRGLRRRQPAIDIVRVQDAGLSGADDSTILQWAAEQGRVLLTHDVSTTTKHAYERLCNGQPMPGVFEVIRTSPIARVIDDLLLLAECSMDGEWEGQVRYLPLR
jgi:hypothetical protein